MPWRSWRRSKAARRAAHAPRTAPRLPHRAKRRGVRQSSGASYAVRNGCVLESGGGRRNTGEAIQSRTLARLPPLGPAETLNNYSKKSLAFCPGVGTLVVFQISPEQLKTYYETSVQSPRFGFDPHPRASTNL